MGEKSLHAVGRGIFQMEEAKTRDQIDGIRLEFYLCLLWRRIYITDNGLSYLTHQSAAVG